MLTHSQAALELRQPFFPTHLNAQKLRNFHRYVLKRYLTGILSNEQVFHPVYSLLKKGYHLNKKTTTLFIQLKWSFMIVSKKIFLFCVTAFLI